MNETEKCEAVLMAGADGYPDGWVCARALVKPAGGLGLVAIEVARDFAELVARTADCAALAVDIPIGLSADGRREVDFVARKLIGPRRSSVFPVPARRLLTAGSYAEANALSRSSLGKGLSAQAYGIVPKIREVDSQMTPATQDRIVESHPEVCFWALAGQEPLPWSKHTPEGREHRLRLLETVYGKSVRALTPPRHAKRDDLYDACVLAWTAARVADGSAVHLPGTVERDERGLRMEMVY